MSSIHVHETSDSPRREYRRATRKFLIIGPDTIADAKVIVLNPTGNPDYCPTVYDGLLASDYSLEGIPGKDGYYIAEITYEAPDFTPNKVPHDGTGFSELSSSFTTKGATTTRYMGLSDNVSIVPYKQGDEQKNGLFIPRDWGALIGVDDNEVQGVEVIIPNLELTVTRTYNTSEITFLQVKKIYQATGCVNSTSYMGFAAGELLFRGCDANFNEGKWTITFDFQAQPNVTNMTIICPVVDLKGQKVTGVFEIGNKKGWEYIWMEFQEGTGTVQKFIRQINKIAVYPELNFNNYLPL